MTNCERCGDAVLNTRIFDVQDRQGFQVFTCKSCVQPGDSAWTKEQATCLERGFHNDPCSCGQVIDA